MQFPLQQAQLGTRTSRQNPWVAPRPGFTHLCSASNSLVVWSSSAITSQ
jgi:hypothetical protein